jgi:hypothetical protein
MGNPIIPPELLNEKKPEKEDEILFDILFQIYSPETNFYVALDAYCRIWGIELTGDEISTLFLLWREIESYSRKTMNEQRAKAQSTSKGKGSPKSPPKRGSSRGSSRRPPRR